MHLSIVIPTYNEKDNVSKIANKIRTILANESHSYEILFVDDSSDDTPNVLEQLSNHYPEVRYIHRTTEKGLASAVVQGFKHSHGDYIIVMDADLQHPPELIPLILKRLAQADIVIPSRFIAGGSDGGLNWLRKLISWTARSIGRFSIKRLRAISDCTSGYFGLKRQVITTAELNPIGWKILMEVLVKGSYRSVHEIPYSFVARDAGQSKMDLKEQLNYLKHISKLVSSSPEDRRFFAFCLIGLLGVLVNIACLAILLNMFQLDELAGSVGASLLAMFHNFIWNDNVTWKERTQQVWWKRMMRLPMFMAICGLGIALTAVFAQFFVWQHWNIYWGQLTGIIVATGWTYTANNRWTWPNPGADKMINHSQLTVTQEYASKLS
ncbi:Undecaprenyl-phosphate 4-deoxy-4-formamido-L-arabinose transferase [bioreactor metagenome]|uniref:Undecaprenyl-phosphate 4-deoxy-4-formamido-L-arabinose transferase n=1 Tax=bioreactor metagenome TaxID=1076179 RepID=A0A645CMP1_9ZZZZ